MWEEKRKARRARKDKNARFSAIKRKSLRPGSSNLWNQLLLQLQFDTAAAERLINSLKQKHPGKSERWYIEKAIQDLDRDRRR